jgi:hypothetical protein
MAQIDSARKRASQFGLALGVNDSWRQNGNKTNMAWMDNARKC